MATKQERAEALKKDWATNARWKDVKTDYTAEEVINISGSVQIEYTLAKNGAEKLWKKLHTDDWVAGLGAFGSDFFPALVLIALGVGVGMIDDGFSTGSKAKR